MAHEHGNDEKHQMPMLLEVSVHGDDVTMGRERKSVEELVKRDWDEV